MSNHSFFQCSRYIAAFEEAMGRIDLFLELNNSIEPINKIASPSV